MDEQVYENFLTGKEERSKLLSPYEGFVKEKLKALPSASTAQVHDWLKEHHSGFPPASPHTVYNFVIWVRQRYRIMTEERACIICVWKNCPAERRGRQISASIPLAAPKAGRKSGSSAWCSRPAVISMSTSVSGLSQQKTAIDAHEAAFRFFGGIPKEIVLKYSPFLGHQQRYF